MKVTCKNCLPKEGVVIPDFSLSDKKLLIKLKQESSIQAIKHILNVYAVSHHTAKYIVTHINNKNECNKCTYKNLEGEYIHCPKCKALNFNWEE